METDKLGGWFRTHRSSDVKPELDGEEATVLGWVHDIRDLGGIRFILLKDRTGKVQITIPRDKANDNVLAKAEVLHKQDAIGVRGIIKKMQKAPGGAEIVPKELRILGIAKQPLPLDVSGRTPAEIDVRLNARVLDLCREENQAIFRIQHVALEATRSFLSEKGFIEVYTPRIIVSATEGGAALFPVAYFKQEAFLAQSPQLYKEQLILDFEKVFEIGPFFRAEESNTRRHLSEFISIDVEEAFANDARVMMTLEALVNHVCKDVKRKCVDELILLKHIIAVPTTPFKRFTYDQILEELREEGVRIPWGEDIPTHAFRALGRLHPYYYFITAWPTKTKAFYIKPRDDTPKVSEGFDLVWKWIELSSGGSRIHSKTLLIKRMRDQGLHPEAFKHHLQAFDYGMPPHAGWAIGLGRFVMALTGKRNIREVVLFPRDRLRLTP